MQDRIAPSSYQVTLSTGTGDCLVALYPFLAKMRERGVALPLPFPETICFEHHFPRGWFYFEDDAPAATAAHHHYSAQQAASSGPPSSFSPLGATAAGHGDADGSDDGAAGNLSSSGAASAAAATTAMASATEEPSLAKKLVRSSVLRSLMGLPQQQSADKQDGGSSPSRTRMSSVGVGNRVLMRRAPKDCDSGSIRTVFSPRGGAKRQHMIGCEVALRDPATGVVSVQFLDAKGLQAFLMNTPEQCVLSRAVTNRRRNYDVIVATWTPSVFSIEHRVNVNDIADASIAVQQRGDTTTTSLYNEAQTCPLLASRVREALQRLVWILAKHERMTTLEVRATLRQDSHMQLWLLWVDVLRLVPMRIVRHVTADELIDEHRRDAEQREQRRKRVARSHSTLQQQQQQQQHQQQQRSYGAWPSFTRDSDISVELLMHVEDLLEDTMRRAREGHTAESIRRASSVLMGSSKSAAVAAVSAARKQRQSDSSPHGISSVASRGTNASRSRGPGRALTPLPSLSTGLVEHRRGVFQPFAPMVPLTLQLAARDGTATPRFRHTTATPAAAVAVTPSASAALIRVHFEEVTVDRDALEPLEPGSHAPPPSPRPDDTDGAPLVETAPLKVLWAGSHQRPRHGVSSAAVATLAAMNDGDFDNENDGHHDVDDETAESIGDDDASVGGASLPWQPRRSSILFKPQQGNIATSGDALLDVTLASAELATLSPSHVTLHSEGMTTPSRSPMSRDRNNERRAVGHNSNNNAANDDDAADLPPSIRQLKARVVAKRVPGPSAVHLQEVRRTRYSTVEGHVNDPYYQSVARDVQATRNTAILQPVRRIGGLRRVTQTTTNGAAGGRRTTTSGGASDDEFELSGQLMSMDGSVIAELRGLDVQQRLDYNAIRANHVAILAGIDDLAYRVFSASLQQRARVPIPFDLPPASPMPDMRRVLALGFHDIEELPELAATTTDPLFCVSGEINIRRAFSLLKGLVGDCCRAIEREFLANCRRSDVLESEEGSVTNASSRKSSPLHFSETMRSTSTAALHHTRGDTPLNM